MNESQLRDAVMRYLNSQSPHVYAIKHHGGPYSTAGVPDILACVRGRFVAIELKADHKQHASKLQQVHLDRISRANGLAHVAYSVDQVREIVENAIAEIESGLQDIGNMDLWQQQEKS